VKRTIAAILVSLFALACHDPARHRRLCRKVSDPPCPIFSTTCQDLPVCSNPEPCEEGRGDPHECGVGHP